MSKPKEFRHVYLTIITVVSLVLLLGLQIRWTILSILQEESNFSQLTTIALSEAHTEVVAEYPNCCNKIEPIICNNGKCETKGEAESKIDSIIKKNLKKYSRNIDYKLNLQTNPNNNLETNKFNHSINDSTNLQIEFPNRESQIMRQMKGMFISSILFILVLATTFYLLIRLLKAEKLRRRDTEDFINNMVHEFQTPISNIKLSSNMLTKRLPNLKHEEMQLLTIIKNENERLSDNMLKILNLNSINNCETLKENIDIHETIIYCTEIFKNSNNSFTLQLDAQNSNIKANPNQIEHFIINIIENGLKYSPNLQEITITTHNTSNSIIIRISDKGIGIARENIDKIFDKYYRIDNQNIHNVKGFGIGLAYVKEIIRNNGGTISVESSLGNGSTFVVELPIIKGQI